MLSVEEALAEVAEATGTARCAVERVSLDDALGRVLAEDVHMDHDVPPFHRAAMDGFAVAAGVAVGARLRLAGRVAAGGWPRAPVGPGEAVRINTGAPVPDGTARVLPVEWTVSEGGEVRVERLPTAATHVVARGEHVAAGGLILSRGVRLGPGALGALAAAGRAQVAVAARPTVAVLATGTELVAVDAVPSPGQIRNSNASLLGAQARRHGARVEGLGIARDEMDDLRRGVRAGLEADILVLSGGVSMGDRDLVPAALEAEGVERVFHHWAVQPGGPLWFGRRADTLVFGLPGNPAASFVGFEMLAVPAIGARLGLPFAARRSVPARFQGVWGRAIARRRFRPVRLEVAEDGGLVAHALPWRGSGDPIGMASADGLAMFAEGLEAPASGRALVDVVRLEALP